ncbi:hypothetical protein Vafri_3824 [Volvox africanus]|uniref:Uncharacterized protein n=1 Tax=Volvox africanus TaxID=51714 RepID=A0A8J4ATW9_9CHLO|nr:hypothetical protein Vafri_3824 [Volvox africanus]
MIFARRVGLGAVDCGGGDGLVSVVGEEGTRTSVRGLVVGGFGDGEVGGPIILHGLDVGAEGLFDGTVGAFGLAVGLGVVGRGDVEGGANMLPERLPNVSDEAGSRSKTMVDDRPGRW